MDIQTLPLAKLNPAPYNPRIDLKPDDPRYKRIVQSLDAFGLVEPLIWNSRSGNLVGGHQRLKVLQARGELEATVSVVDLPSQKERALNLALNKVGGDWDTQKLSEILGDLLRQHESLDFAFEATGFDVPETEQLLEAVPADTSADERFDLDKELRRKSPTVTEPGELIELGRHGVHRLICGDALDPSITSMLFGTHTAALCHTDPPYGVRYDPKQRNAKSSAPTSDEDRFATLRNDDLTPSRYKKWFGGVVCTLDRCLTPGSPFYIWNGHANFGLMSDLLRQHSFKVSSVITWAKEHFAPGFSDYQEQTEFALYGWKRGACHKWYGPKNASTLWQISRDNTRQYHHPTQKALELAKRAVRNSSVRDDIVFDPFLGGGTTLIASALLGRRCFGIEIEPRFCDVIVRRYIALAGIEAVAPELAARYLVGQEAA